MVKRFGRKFYDLLMGFQIWDGSATLSFYLLLSVFPAMIAFISLSTFLPYQQFFRDIPEWLASYFPDQLKLLFMKVLNEVAKSSRTGLISIGFVGALWTALGGVSAIMRQLNLAQDEDETRSYVKVKLISLLISACLGFTLIVAFAAIIVGRNVFFLLDQNYFIPNFYKDIFNLGRFLVAEIVLFAGFAIVYYWGPAKHQKLSHVLPGAILSSLVFLITTGVYGYYLSHFATYSAFYGSVGAIVGMMMWFYILGFILIIGAAFNDWCFQPPESKGQQAAKNLKLP